MEACEETWLRPEMDANSYQVDGYKLLRTDRPDTSGNYAYTHPNIFKRYDDGYIVREMTIEDARIVQNWFCGLAKISPYDLMATISSFPPGAGFYIGELDGVVVASAIRIPWGGVFYGGYYYVDKNHRGRGYGTRLRDQVARAYVGDSILCVDVVEGSVAEKNQKKFGYVFAFKTGRYAGVVKASYGKDYTGGKIVTVEDVAFDDIIAYDNKCFIRPNDPARKAFLKTWLKVAGGVAFVALDNDGNIVGYGQRRPCFQEDNHQVGPLYAENATIASALLKKLCSDIDGKIVTINIWMPNEAALRMVEDFQLKKVFTVDRMHVNGDPKEYKETTFAVTSIEVCGF